VRRLGPEQLRDGDVEGVVEAEVPHLRGAQREESSGVDLEVRLRDHLADQLEIPNRSSEGLPLLHILHGGLEGGSGHADRTRRDANPPAVQGSHRLIPSVPALAYQVVLRDPAMLEGEIRGRTRPKPEL